MLNSIKFLIAIIVTLFLNFSYGSLNISPNYGKFKAGDKITLIFNSNRKVNNATISYHSIHYSLNKGIDILKNINEEKFEYVWEIPEEINNDIGYFALWDNGSIFIERSNNIAIINKTVLKNKRYDDENKINNIDKTSVELENNDEENNDEEKEKKKDKKENVITNLEQNTINKEHSNEFVGTIANSNKDTDIKDSNKSEIKNTKSGFNNLYIIIGAGVIVVIIFAFLFVKLNSSKNEIPTGKRSMKRFTLREENVPPITKYNDTWKNTLSKNKSFNTLPNNLNKNKKLSDEETEQLINGDNLISDAEKFARKHGLTDTEWVARKDYIPYREDELEIYQGNRIKVFELYDDLWCYGMNLDHYGTLSNDNEGMFPSSILPLEVITQLLVATKAENKINTNIEQKSQTNTNEVTIDCSDDAVNSNENQESNKNVSNPVVNGNSQFTLPKPLAVPLMPPKPLPNIPNLNRNSSLRSSVHRKRNSNIIDPSKSPLIMNAKRMSQLSNISNNGKRVSQLSNLSNEIKITQEKTSKQKKRTSHQGKILFISTNSSQKERKNEDVKHLLSSPESDFQNRSTDESLSAISPINNLDLKQKQPVAKLVSPIKDEADTSIIRQKDELYQQQLLIQKQREQLQQQKLEQQKLQEQLKQQQLHQQLQQQQIQMQLKQLQQLQQEKERQLLQQKQQIQKQIQQQQMEQEQLRIQREQQQIIQKSKLKEIEYERERLLHQSMNKQENRDSILPSYTEAVNNNPYNFSSSSSSENMVEGFPLPPNMSIPSPKAMSPVSSSSGDQDPELYPRNTSYKHQIQKRDLPPEDYPRNISRAYVDEHPSIGRKIKQTKNEEQSSNNKEKSALKQKEAMNYQ
ncbi:hypothetical protein BCR36DRAFT_330757 [Piromyces finnis]|uniref:SH3 domain-containing protein n=1 Tax=Piromyces finnis TaxID=1754191 RepID=A0A1Y1V501_9FUNG|nr:hypothetical protein BCR36DRAFT_330757 [Piromyces finnis]|eukprot:ORX47355.1 hypothetical protein BCR36DRAFT_330757 [Piromyces finnis]